MQLLTWRLAASMVWADTNIRVLKLLAEDMLQANRATMRQLSEQLLRWAPPRIDALPPDVAARSGASGGRSGRS
jgi:hypothetical protein